MRQRVAFEYLPKETGHLHRELCHNIHIAALVTVRPAHGRPWIMQKRHKVVAVVDDDPSMLGAVESLLDVNGYETALFASAEEFLLSGIAARIDCLLLDIHLGGVSGIELRRRLKASGSRLPVIFMTAVDDEGIRLQALRAGCVACLRKPFAARQLVDAIEKAVPGGRLRLR